MILCQRVAHMQLNYWKHGDPANSTYSRMTVFSRPFCPCVHEQMQAHRHVHTPVERAMSVSSAAVRAGAATAADVALRAVRVGTVGAIARV